MRDHNVLSGPLLEEVGRILGPALEPTAAASLAHSTEDHLFVWNDKYGFEPNGLKQCCGYATLTDPGSKKKSREIHIKIDQKTSRTSLKKTSHTT